MRKNLFVFGCIAIFAFLTSGNLFGQTKPTPGTYFILSFNLAPDVNVNTVLPEFCITVTFVPSAAQQQNGYTRWPITKCFPAGGKFENFVYEVYHPAWFNEGTYEITTNLGPLVNLTITNPAPLNAQFLFTMYAAFFVSVPHAGGGGLSD